MTAEELSAVLGIGATADVVRTVLASDGRPTSMLMTGRSERLRDSMAGRVAEDGKQGARDRAGISYYRVHGTPTGRVGRTIATLTTSSRSSKICSNKPRLSNIFPLACA